MAPKSSAHYQRQYRERLREQGLVKKEVWILPENAQELTQLEKQLRSKQSLYDSKGELSVTENTKKWTTADLYDSLATTDLVLSGKAVVELIDGIDQAIYLVMTEYGDLPVFVTVAGEQIIAESVLWSVADVSDPHAFNEAILRTHKYFPLSTVSLDKAADEGDYYTMFGALSAASSVHSIVLEVEVLASNVIQATEAYAEFLSTSAAAS